MYKKPALLALLLFIPLNALIFQNATVGFVLFISSLALTTLSISPYIAPERTPITQLFFGALAILLSILLIGTGLYYLIPIPISVILLLTLSPILLSLALPEKDIPLSKSVDISKRHTALFLLFLISIASWWIPLFSVEITSAVRSPWNILDPRALFAIFIASFALASLALTKAPTRLTIGSTCILLFSVLAFGFTLYPLGYGFDPFIHRATIQHIAEHGTITPKPLYYIGQYILELIAVHSFSLPLKTVDTVLVPLLLALITPVSAYIGFRSVIKRPIAAILSLILIPFSAFIITTPQGLAYVFILSLLFLSLGKFNKDTAVPWSILALLTAGTLAIHPLAGIPAVLYFIILLLIQAPIKKVWVITILAPISLLSATILPLVFFLQAQSSGLSISLHPERIFLPIETSFSGYFQNGFNTWLDLLYLVGENQLLIAIIFSALGTFILWKKTRNNLVLLPVFMVVLWFVNYWILKHALEFSFLIEYERDNYANRLLELMQIFLLPGIGFLFASASKQLEKRPTPLTMGFIFIMAILATSQTYMAYPRDDGYARSSGFNVAKADYDAAYAIHEHGQNEDYIVLANQTVSSAALETFGFKTYYHGNIFYYPIPTGGVLYEYYLEMADNAPTKTTAIQAMDTAGVDLAYFVLNDYWWRSEVILERAKREADDWFAVADGAITIFVYLR